MPSAEVGAAGLVGPKTVGQGSLSVEKDEMMRENEKVASGIDVLTVGDEMVSPGCPEGSTGAAESFELIARRNVAKMGRRRDRLRQIDRAEGKWLGHFASQ